MRRNTTRRTWLAGSLAGALAAAAAPPVRLPKKVRVGLIGLDTHYGEIVEPLTLLPDVELVAVTARRESLPPQLAGARLYRDYRQMLDRERLDVVGVCNQNGERAGAILACLERKVHVAAEKPLAIERSDLDAIRRAVRKQGVRLTMLLSMRFEPAYAAMKKLVEAGAIGEVGQVSAQKSYKIDERPEWYRHRNTYGGTIPWIGIHMIDLMRWTGGREFTEAVSYQTRLGFPAIGEMENVTGSLFRLDNGGVGLLRIDYLRPKAAPTHGDDRLRLAGTRGVLEYQASTGVTLMAGERPPEAIKEFPEAKFLFIDFLESIYLGKTHRLTESDIFRVNEIVLLARESAERHQIVKL
ncbi:MAG TPA: Gfo/Idh/MocA family oxidoreductase [Bryobacteraceae bacterium]|nr:Gfo/Idh/MocA family oxidoreductase [Bryobacteraceae bacterium]